MNDTLEDALKAAAIAAGAVVVVTAVSVVAALCLFGKR